MERRRVAAGPPAAEACCKVLVQYHYLRDVRTASANLTFSSEDLDLVELAKQGLIREGDLIVYRRNFPTVNVLVEKELLVSCLLR